MLPVEKGSQGGERGKGGEEKSLPSKKKIDLAPRKERDEERGALF